MVVGDVVRHVLVPGLLASGLVSAYVSAGRVPPAVRDAARGGFWGGVFLVAVYIVVPARSGDLAFLPRPVWAGLIGAVLGAAAPALFAGFRTTRAVGVVVLLQAAGSAGLLAAFFAGARNESQVWLVLGAAIGISLTGIWPRRWGLEQLAEWIDDRQLRRGLRAEQRTRERLDIRRRRISPDRVEAARPHASGPEPPNPVEGGTSSGLHDGSANSEGSP